MALWTPADITTELWLDGDDASTITESGGQISQWDDKSGNARHATQATSANQPFTYPSAIGGLDAVDFYNPDSNFMTLGTALNGLTQATVYIVIWLYDGLPATAAKSGLWTFTNGGAETQFPDPSNNINDSFGSTARKATGSPSASLTSARIYCVHSRSGDWTSWIDGVQHYTTATNTFGIAGTNYIGRSADGSDYYLTAAVGEIVVVEGSGAPSTSDRQIMEGYLAHKWGLTANLDAGHPYKSAAPVGLNEGFLQDTTGPLDPPLMLAALEVSGDLDLTDDPGASIELLIQGGGTAGTTALVEATGATVTPWAGAGADPWEYNASSTRYASTNLYQTLSGTMRYDVTVPGGLGSVWTFDLQIAPNGSGTRYIFGNPSNYVAAGDSLFYLYRSGSTVYLYANGGNRLSTIAVNGGWVYLRLSYNGTLWTLQKDNTVIGTYSDPGREWTGETYELFGRGTTSNTGPMSGRAEDIRITKGLARVGDAPGASMTYPEVLSAATYYGPLQEPQILGVHHFGYLQDNTGPLQPPSIVGVHHFGYIQDSTGPLSNALNFLGYSNILFAASGSESINYVADLTTPSGTVRVPIRSWQATYRLGSIGYFQAVIPNAGEWLTEAAAATAFSIYQVINIGGLDIEYPIDTLTIERKDYAQGATNYSVILIGYPAAITDTGTTIDAYDQTLTGIRSIFSGSSGYRVRCKPNMQLRPGHRAYIDDVTSFKVDYVTYYAFESDSYMDVGD